MLHQDYISINAEIRFGKPCVKGTRISVFDVLGWLAAGMTITEIVDDFPELNEKSVLACLAYAADKERRVRIAA
jgi:uncharacterized protein (DUF433 family)